jgi:hypothetical protein
MSTDSLVETFIARWQATGGSERGNYQLFLNELCDLLGVERPQPHAAEERDNAYVYERRVQFRHGDGSDSAGFIDLYRRSAFVLEAKKLRQGTHTRGFDEAMLRARSQAENYARALSADEGRPPFVVVVDVGQRIELYSEFSRSGGTYTPFPDPRSHRIALADLRDEAVRERLRRVWNEPMSLDPSRESARVTREIALRLAELARSLERAKHAPELVAQFLMRCLFTMFAEDVRLLPKDCFRDLLTKYAEQPDVAMRMLAQLWRDMDGGGFSAVLADDVLQFNGKLFKQPDTLALDRDQLALLLRAAKADWRHVEPAIFGTLLERALSPDERHKLGAHYTPRAYVERLVLPTVIEPLREEWDAAKAAALVQLAEAEQARAENFDTGKLRSNAERLKQYNIELRKARDIVLDFHKRLCAVRVLDPACGSGNFLYVTLEHLKRLEGEVLLALDEMGLSRLGVTEQTGIDMEVERAINTEAETVDPHNLLGIELNPRAAAIAEVVLWIGYLQWHFRTRGDVSPPQPVIRDFRNIECRDAVLAYDDAKYITDERGVPLTRWDGKTMKPSAVTGEDVPDDSARVSLERYINPRKAAWPAADFVVGNPPFIGNKRMRIALGDGYVEALRGAWNDVPDSADFVMYWWHHAAQLTRRGRVERFGFITTNSIRQAFNRRVLEQHLSDKKQPLSLVFAIPDHPWVDTADGAAVRIAMTAGAAGSTIASRRDVESESELPDGESSVVLREKLGVMFADLSVGADVSSSRALLANSKISSRGVIPHGENFILSPDQAASLGLGRDAAISRYIRPYRNGKDLTQRTRGVFAIYLHGLDLVSLRSRFPEMYQWLHDRVKPERDQSKDRQFREEWWLPGRARPDLIGLIESGRRYVATVQTSKHRFFTFLDSNILPDDKLIAIALEDAKCLGILSSQVHSIWALASGATLEDRPVYNKSTCFDCFPFPNCLSDSEDRLRTLAENLDNHRKRQQAAHSDLTLTGMYNVLEKLRSGETLMPKERTIHEQGLVSVLRQIHDELDAAVLDAYGWSDLLPLLRVAHGNEAEVRPHPPSAPSPASGGREEVKRAFEEAILERLVALNAERAAEEARGLVRWLRPEFQNPPSKAAPRQDEMEATVDDEAETESTHVAVASKPLPWPRDVVDQVRAVAEVLAASPIALDAEMIATRFTARGPWKKRLPQLLQMLVAVGRADEQDGAYRARR